MIVDLIMLNLFKIQEESYKFNSSIQEIDNADAILLVGSNPRWEAAVLNARIRKAYIK